MKRLSLLLAALPCVACAIDLSGLADLAFAEEYAFATNRAALIATLKPDSPAYWTYAVLDAQTRGDLAAAENLLERLRERKAGPRVENAEALRDRQTLLAWDADPKNPKLWERFCNVFRRHGLGAPDFARATELAPNTYPSVLDPQKTTFAAFWERNGRSPANLKPAFAFLPLAKDVTPATADWFDPTRADGTLATASDDVLAATLAWLKDADRRHVFGTAGIFPAFTVAQLERIQRETKGHAKDVSASAEFAQTMLDKIALGADDDPEDEVLVTAVLDRRVAFTRTLDAKLKRFRIAALQARLDFAAARGEELLELTDELDGLLGRPSTRPKPEEPDLVVLEWSKRNPRRFAGTEDVTLGLDVKNVKKVRLAVYALDPFAACAALDGEVKADLDLDAAVPTAVRTLDCTESSRQKRTTERLAFPELKEPGLYVVDCTGEGLACRAFVRKGRLRVVTRRDAAGHVFTALDAAGRVVKGTKLKVDGQLFSADEQGEISVSFAGDAKTAGEKTALVSDGRLATPIRFTHATETLSLDLQAVIPPETLVAGCTAKVLLRPDLRVSGVSAPIGLLEKPVLTATFLDHDGRRTVKTYPNFRLSDTAEGEFAFTVPARLKRVELSLAGEVRRVTNGEAEHLSATSGQDAGSIGGWEETVQGFLRRTAAGYVAELRGRAGEPLAGRELVVELAHRLFARGTVRVTLQTDAEGRLDLGPLTDIAWISIEGMRARWTLQPQASGLPAELSARTGEPFVLPVRGLLKGDWPSARELRARLSLQGVTAEGRVTDDWLSACAWRDEVLTVAGLPAGDYELKVRGAPETCRLHVVGTAAPAGGLLTSAGRARAADVAPARPHIASVTRADGRLRIALARATPETRVHVFVARTLPADGEGRRPEAVLRKALVAEPPVSGVLHGATSSYIAGRHLGDALRYVYDRRNEPGRIGNLLFRPSLLLNPWSTQETATQDIKDRAGETWDAAAADIQCEDMDGGLNRHLASRYGGRSMTGFGGVTPCRDFLPEAEQVFANLRPDADGIVTLALTETAGQDVTVQLTDGIGVDEVVLAGTNLAFTPRDLRHTPAAGKSYASAARRYETVGELFGLLASLCEDTEFGKFAFVATWSLKDEDEKRALYGTYASHELDVFLREKDPAFFASVVVPHLRNKRRKDFVDLALLGADVSAYAEPARFADLNAFEKCLLARSCPERAPQVAKYFADLTAACPASPETYDAALAVALGDADPAGAAPDAPVANASYCLAEAAEPPPMEEVDMACEPMAPVAPEAPRMALKSARVADKRRAAVPLWRPPERTKEWVETGYYRQQDGAVVEIEDNDFWRDYAAAIAAGKTAGFRTENVMLAADGPAACLMALAVTDLPFTAEKGGPALTFARPAVAAPEAPVSVATRYTSGDDEVTEFVAGHVYRLETVVMNPSDRERYVRVRHEIPVGAVPLNHPAAETFSRRLQRYKMQGHRTAFYFPYADVAGTPLPVVAKASRTDTASWAHVAAHGSKAEVLEYLRTRNLFAEDVELEDIGWRFADGTFARNACEILSARGAYNRGLWLAGFRWADAFDVARLREALAQKSSQRMLADLGPYLKTSFLTLDPELDDAFAHKEYWPIVNARVHGTGGVPVIANEGLRRRYRAFLDLLAAKPTLTADDRLRAAVYLLAQDRTEAAREQLAQVDAKDVESRLQLDYLNAYLAFSDGDAAKGRRLAVKYADYPVALWRDRFRAVIAQADEIAAADAAEVPAAQPPVCTIAAYPVDAEIAFSKDPFGTAAQGRDLVRAVRPVWTAQLPFTDWASVRAKLPQTLAAESLVLVAEGADGREVSREETVAKALDVRVTHAVRQLRVKTDKGQPLAGAYVKVYARGANGEIQFFKDGYTDLRGAFDYASVSSDSAFRPAAFAVLVLHPTEGLKTLRISAGN